MDSPLTQVLRDILSTLDADDWQNLRDTSVKVAKMKSYYSSFWYNVKYFPKEHGDPDHVQLNDPACLFRVTGARFSLRNQAVAYFSVAPYIGMMETKCRNVNDATAVRKAWLEENWCPDPKRYGHLLEATIIDDTPILDLSFPNNPLFARVDADSKDLLGTLTTSRDVALVYPASQIFSEVLVDHGFEGLIWDSVRYRRRGVNEPRQVMVVYDETALKIM
jgi:hypothetical protein